MHGLLKTLLPPSMPDAGGIKARTQLAGDPGPVSKRLFRDYLYWWAGAAVGSFLTAFVLESDFAGMAKATAIGILIPGAMTVVVRAVCWTIDRRLNAAQTLSTFVIAWAIFHGVIQVLIWYGLLTT